MFRVSSQSKIFDEIKGGHSWLVEWKNNLMSLEPSPHTKIAQVNALVKAVPP